MRLQGKVALVTGAGRWIGRAVALTFAREGADVIIGDPNIETAEKVAAEVRPLGRRAQAIKVDVSKLEEVNQMVERALEAFQRIDILVNGAGISQSTSIPTLELSEAEWDRVVSSDLKGAFLCSQAVGKQMIAQKSGKIINIACIAGHRGTPENVAYCVSKGAILQLTKVLAVEWAKYNVNVNSVTPALTFATKSECSAPDVERRVRKIPLGRANVPQDIANAVLFLASPEADNIVGQDISVDGGQLALHPGYF